MKELDLYSFNYYFIGPRTDIEEIMEELSIEASNRVDGEKVLECKKQMKSGFYTTLPCEFFYENYVYMDETKIAELNKRYPNCEFFYYIPKYKEYIFYGTNSKTKVDDFLEFHDRHRLAEKTKDARNKITVTLKDGKILEFYNGNSELESLMDSIDMSKLTVKVLSDISCDYVAAKRQKTFLTDFVKKIPTVDLIQNITVDISVSYRDIPIEYRGKLSEPSVTEFFFSYLCEERNYNIDLNDCLVTKKSKTSIYAPEAPIENKNEYIYTVVDELPIKENKFVMSSEEGNTIFEFEDVKSSGVISSCTSNSSIIQIPNASEKGAVITAIESHCFFCSKNVEKVILPKTIRTIHEDAFIGCDKLKSIVYDDDIENEGAFEITKGATLVFLHTSEANYTIPKDINTISNFAFSSCTKLKNINLHNEVKTLRKDSFSKCKRLARLTLSAGVNKIDSKVLINAKVKEIAFSNGDIVKFRHECMYEAIEEVNGELIYSYSKASSLINKISLGSAKARIAIDMLANHSDDITADEISGIADVAIRYCVSKKDARTLDKIFKLNLKLNLDFEGLIKMATGNEYNEILMILLSNSKSNSSNVERIYYETPANEMKDILHIKVQFENNRTYAYYCKFAVNVGDKVFVDGKMSNAPGKVVEIVDRYKYATNSHILNVKSAFNVVVEEIIQDLKDL